MSFGVFVEGLSSLSDLKDARGAVRLAAARAINKTTFRGRAAAARYIREQVAFPAGYVSQANKRLFVSRTATEGSLEGAITARGRATSLARFVRGTPAKGQGVTVVVAPGRARTMRRAFVVRLRAGTADLDTKSNMGLAMRLRPGETLSNKRELRKLTNGLYLLYGPSVDQVFRARDGGGVAEDIAPELADFMEREFLRLLEL